MISYRTKVLLVFLGKSLDWVMASGYLSLTTPKPNPNWVFCVGVVSHTEGVVYVHQNRLLSMPLNFNKTIEIVFFT